MATENTARLAVLIDADNAQPSITKGLLAEVAKYGTAHVKRAYGDWTGPNLRGWKDQLLAQSIHPIQQFAYTKGKNATDAAMVIDAMDLLYSGRFDGFCIVSSDSDFTRLAQRLRESGHDGVRVRRAQDAQAVRRRVRQVHLRREPPVRPRSEDAGGARRRASSRRGARPRRRRSSRATPRSSACCASAVEAASDDDGWAPLSAIGNIITNQRPDFDSRSYGYGKLSDLIKATTLFEIERHSPGDGKQAIMYAREKRRRPRRRPARRRRTADGVRDRREACRDRRRAKPANVKVVS